MKKEYLNEEWYQGVKKKIITISIVICIISFVIGGALIGASFVKKAQAKKINEQRYQEAYKRSEENVAKAKARLEEIKKEKESLNAQLSEKEFKCNSMDMMASNWFADNSKCQNETSSIRSQIQKLESEEFQLENADYTVYYTKINPKKYNILIFIGLGVIVFGSAVAFAVYLIAMKREIAAFKAQQIMPVAQEGIEKMAPTIGNAAGEIAKGVSSSINQGNNNGQE